MGSAFPTGRALELVVPVPEVILTMHSTHRATEGSRAKAMPSNTKHWMLLWKHLTKLSSETAHVQQHGVK